ncbi:MAG: 6-carboxytetrahydropterin synthase, partial [Verrucomicrobiota bacterium]|nr:6-carboxytetrahydropterin synthase [Verrucomicrobiota bacterium]
MVPEGHKCARLHGHSFRFEIHVRGPVDPRSGWLIDYGEISDAVRPVRKELDHQYLNEIP